jgi:hypothetical protein
MTEPEPLPPDPSSESPLHLLEATLLGLEQRLLTWLHLITGTASIIDTEHIHPDPHHDLADPIHFENQ